jgi:hypothetical protein
VGAKSFLKGTAQIIGVSPATTAGTDTVINANTFWGNESITLIGNVTVSGGSLTIYNSNITFDETAKGTTYEYGIMTQNKEPLYIRHGTIMKISSPTTENGFFVYANTYNGNGAVIEVTNTTIYENSTDNVAPQPGGVFYDSWPVVFDPTRMSYSTYIGNDKINEALSQGIYGYGVGSEEQYFVNHSLIEYGVLQALSPSNDTFIDNSTVHWTAVVGAVYSPSYDTFSSTLNGSYQAPINQKGVIIRNTIFSNLVFDYKSTSNFDGGLLYECNGGGNLSVSNVTFSKITIYNSNNSLSGSPEITYGIFFGSNVNASFTHITVGKLLTGGEGAPVTSALIYINPPEINGTDVPLHNYVNFTDSYVGENAMINDTSYTQAGVLQVAGKELNISSNIFRNFQAIDMPIGYKPSFSTNSFLQEDVGRKMRNDIIYTTCPINGTFNNNWLINVTGQTSLFAMIGYGYRTIENNTIINETEGGTAIAIAKGSPTNATHFTISHNSIFGLYNYSTGIGDPLEGGNNSDYVQNYFYDVDTTSYGYLGISANASFADTTGSFFLTNTNGTYEGSYVSGEYHEHASRDLFYNDIIQNLSLNAIHFSSPFPVQTYRAVLPNDYNLTFEDSYVPSSFFMVTGQNGSRRCSVNLFNISNGPYTVLSPYSNSNFMSLEGYLGIYVGQTYTLNASNIKNEASLPIYYSGSEIADIPASSAHYNFTALGVDKYSISTPSSKSDPVKLYFQGIADALYDVEMISNGTVVSTFTEYANATGVLNTTYNPSTMPLDPIFTVAYVGSVASPPVVPPLVPIVPHVLFGIPYLNVIVLFGGIALASEEFFRTQAKGKEKKYSYTGIFVGIMIAGIGLMSVL